MSDVTTSTDKVIDTSVNAFTPETIVHNPLTTVVIPPGQTRQIGMDTYTNPETSADDWVIVYGRYGMHMCTGLEFGIVDRDFKESALDYYRSVMLTDYDTYPRKFTLDEIIVIYADCQAIDLETYYAE